MTAWLLFTYKVPNEPSARRVYVWRKLKGLGAILLHDTAWVLPDTPHTREKLQWLTTEVRDMEGGEATLWEADQVFTGQGTDLTAEFRKQVDTQYQEILVELKMPNADLAALAKRFQQIKQRDYFQSTLGAKARQEFIKRRGAD